MNNGTATRGDFNSQRDILHQWIVTAKAAKPPQATSPSSQRSSDGTRVNQFIERGRRSSIALSNGCHRAIVSVRSHPCTPP